MAILVRLQTPADSEGMREDMDIITSADAVYIGEKTLTQRIDEITATVAGPGVIVSSRKPDVPCLWAEVIKTE